MTNIFTKCADLTDLGIRGSPHNMHLTNSHISAVTLKPRVSNKARMLLCHNTRMPRFILCYSGILSMILELTWCCHLLFLILLVISLSVSSLSYCEAPNFMYKQNCAACLNVEVSLKKRGNQLNI